MKVSPFVDGVVARRFIKCDSTVFSFQILELHGRLSFDIIKILRRCKPILNYASQKWKLPRLVRVLVTDCYEGIGSTVGGHAIGGFACSSDILLNLNMLRELEMVFDQPKEFEYNVLLTFLHELAHYLTKDEKEADKLVRDLLRLFVQTIRRK